MREGRSLSASDRIVRQRGKWIGSVNRTRRKLKLLSGTCSERIGVLNADQLCL